MAVKKRPPKLPDRFLQWYCADEVLETLQGDLYELYEKRREKKGKLLADMMYGADVASACRPFAFRGKRYRSNSNNTVMFQHYLKISGRNMLRNRGYSLINVSGLALGIACSLLAFSIVRYHLGFDDFHSQPDRIYRFVTESHSDKMNYSPSVPPAFGTAFRNDYTFGEKVGRIFSPGKMQITIGEGENRKNFQDDISFVDPEFFEIFNFPAVTGNPAELLAEPGRAFITERIAAKYFGRDSALGRLIRFNNQIDFQVIGILGNIPDNTDFRSEIYFSYSSIGQYNPWYAAPDAWGGISTDIQTFARLREGVDPAAVELVLPEYVRKYRADSKNVHHYKLQPLNDMHLNSGYSQAKNVLWVLLVVGFFLILTACLNFINLATAHIVSRSKEVGIRKTLGSLKSQLFWQFTIETTLIVVVATAMAVGLSLVVLPGINEMFDSRVHILPLTESASVIFLLSLIILVTFATSSYPGLVLSGFKPVQALKGKLSGGGNINLRRVLITVQFTISQVLLIGLIAVMFQLRHFRESDLGFNESAVVMIPLGSRDAKTKTVKELFSQIPQVEKVSLCFAAPASESSWRTMFLFDNKPEAENFPLSMRSADADYVSTFDIELVAGRNVLPSDSVKECLVNETLVRKLGYASPWHVIGKNISPTGREWEGKITGVVKDFHDQSLQSDINPVLISVDPGIYQEYAVRINMANSKDALGALEKVWTSMYPDKVYHYAFLENQLEAFYKTEETMFTLVEAFAFIALFICCIGLYGMVSFMAVQRTREIGIRKVLGASFLQILWIFGREFSRLVLVAFIVAAPLAWKAVSLWLQNYAYGIGMSFWFLAIEIAAVSVLVILSIGFQALNAAKTNPVNSLRSE